MSPLHLPNNKHQSEKQSHDQDFDQCSRKYNNVRAIKKVNSSELLKKQGMRGKLLLYTKKYVPT
jgi:hypothetical protein